MWVGSKVDLCLRIEWKLGMHVEGGGGGHLLPAAFHQGRFGPWDLAIRSRVIFQGGEKKVVHFRGKNVFWVFFLWPRDVRRRSPNLYLINISVVILYSILVCCIVHVGLTTKRGRGGCDGGVCVCSDCIVCAFGLIEEKTGENIAPKIFVCIFNVLNVIVWCFLLWRVNMAAVWLGWTSPIIYCIRIDSSCVRSYINIRAPQIVLIFNVDEYYVWKAIVCYSNDLRDK